MLMTSLMSLSSKSCGSAAGLPQSKEERYANSFQCGIRSFSTSNWVIKSKRLIRERLEAIAIEKTHYSLAEREGDHWRGLHNNDINERETDSIVVESNVVGRDEDRQENVICHLLNPNPERRAHHLFNDVSLSDKNVCVISIIGLAGLGKTTLAKLVYNDERVEKNFDMRMWICASNDLENIRLIRGMISAATKQKCDQYQSLDLMKRGLQDALRGKKFLLVLDDFCENESGGSYVEGHETPVKCVCQRK